MASPVSASEIPGRGRRRRPEQPKDRRAGRCGGGRWSGRPPASNSPSVRDRPALFSIARSCAGLEAASREPGPWHPEVPPRAGRTSRVCPSARRAAGASMGARPTASGCERRCVPPPALVTPASPWSRRPGTLDDRAPERSSVAQRRGLPCAPGVGTGSSRSRRRGFGLVGAEGRSGRGPGFRSRRTNHSRLRRGAS